MCRQAGCRTVKIETTIEHKFHRTRLHDRVCPCSATSAFCFSGSSSGEPHGRDWVDADSFPPKAACVAACCSHDHWFTILSFAVRAGTGGWARRPCSACSILRHLPHHLCAHPGRQPRAAPGQTNRRQHQRENSCCPPQPTRTRTPINLCLSRNRRTAQRGQITSSTPSPERKAEAANYPFAR